jgi:hypothetical protein
MNILHHHYRGCVLISICISEDIWCKHHADILKAHFVIFFVFNKTSHEIDDHHQCVSVKSIHFCNYIYKQLWFVCWVLRSNGCEFFEQFLLAKCFFHVSQYFFDKVSHYVRLFFKCHLLITLESMLWRNIGLFSFIIAYIIFLLWKFYYRWFL